MAVNFNNTFLYRWRYLLGYSLIGVLLIGLLVFAGLYLPGGLSHDEMQSVVTSNNLSLHSPSSLAIADMPYHALQKLSLKLFGAHDFSIKLPSLFLALVSAVGLVFLLRRWFARNIAVLTSLLAITTGQFLFIAQSGTPSIMYVFWPIALLLLGTLVTRATKHRTLWTVLFFVASALSLYTPLSFYPFLAMILAVILHPHLRNVIRHLPKVWLISAGVLSLIIMAPLVLTVILHPGFGLSLLGIPTVMPDFGQNLHMLYRLYLDFWHSSSTVLMTPVFGLGSTLLILAGLYLLVRTRSSTQSYLIIIWVVCLIPVQLLNPGFTTVTFVPAVLLMALGIDELISYWYRLFPRNPYARIAGLIPLTVLVIALISSGLVRYVDGYHYNPETSRNFSKDLLLLPKSTKQLVVASDEQPFWQVVAKYRPGLSIVGLPSASDFTMTRAARYTVPLNGPYVIQRIVTNSFSADADRFYIYKTIAH